MVAAISIWGLIIYRVIRATHNEGGPSIEAIPASAKRLPEMSVDTFTLYNDYPDPFIPAKEEVDTIEEIKPAETKVINSPSDLASENNENIANMVKFRGIVVNPQKKIKVAIVSINNKEFVVRERENVKGIYIRKINIEKLEINYKNKDFAIQKEH